jgi:hypothetical protein
MNRREKRARPALPLARILGTVAGAGATALGLFVAVVDDPLGGEPHARARVEHRAQAPAEAQASAARVVEVPGREPPRSTAVELESESGVRVVRPDGAGAPSSVIVRVPTPPAPVRLAPAPDRRLVERGRHGTLPKVGPDGARALDVYARPVEPLPGGARPAGRVALVIGGLGISQSATAEAIAKLPPAVSLAYAPYGTDLERSVARAREDGHEVLLQVPMEPFDYPDNDPGPHTLTVKGRAENLDRLHWTMGRFAGFVGVMNFMGARITADEAALTPILREIGARGLGFVDDGSSSRSQATAAAARAGVPAARAERVLDAVPKAEDIDRELARLEEAARRGGVVVASASALPLTIDRVARWAQGLEAKGILLVPVSAAMRGER